MIESSRDSAEEVAGGGEEAGPTLVPPPARPSVARVALALALAAVMVVVVLRALDANLADITRVLARARVEWVVAAALLVGVNVWIQAVRWVVMLRAMGYRLEVARALHVVAGLWSVAVVTPSRAGDVVRALVVRDVVPVTQGVGSVVVEKVLDLQALCAFGVVGALSVGRPGLAAIGAAGFVGLTVVIPVGAALAPRADRRRRTAIGRALHLVRMTLTPFRALLGDGRRLAVVLALSAVTWLDVVLIEACLLRAVSIDLSPAAVLAAWIPAILAGLLPLTVAGMGTRDLAFVLMLEAVTAAPVDRNAVLATTLVYSVLTAWAPALLGLPLGVSLLSAAGRPSLTPPPAQR